MIIFKKRFVAKGISIPQIIPQIHKTILNYYKFITSMTFAEKKRTLFQKSHSICHSICHSIIK